ncbi:T9SS type A sorting domain-containing protein [Marinilabilia rubra]|uniref:Secretion system C-terminal sorting domain-containing protein n=1 Tax=Marinilabilia rubra TaxID=2162893 RepID=A0A2U2B792_9BACT|nr:T9SS type A sorting domain-containing protein [Marinilabilia rubra]PWD98916.1 hypothetical protein DDZ16_13020 [Marinilabilia rubra]
MKKSLLFIIGIFMGLATIKAQTVVFEDGFESYTHGDNLTGQGYSVWEGSATVTNAAEAGGDAFSGSNFAQCEPSGNSFYFRKNLTLEEGKTYTFEVMTKSPDGKNHKAVAKVGDRNIAGDLVGATDWTKTSITFTVEAGETEAIMWVYSWPQSRVDIDEFKVIEESATAISKVKVDGPRVTRAASGEFKVSTDNKVSSISVYTSSGQLVKQMTNAGDSEVTFNLNGQSQGLYILRIVDVRGNVSVKKVVNN